MTKQIVMYEWLDWSYKRGDNNAVNFKDYESWLNSLTNDDFLFTYNRVKEASDNLD